MIINESRGSQQGSEYVLSDATKFLSWINSPEKIASTLHKEKRVNELIDPISAKTYNEIIKMQQDTARLNPNLQTKKSGDKVYIPGSLIGAVGIAVLKALGLKR